MDSATRATHKQRLKALITEISRPLATPTTTEVLAALHLDGAASSFQNIATRLSGFPDQLAELILDLAGSPDPPRALINFEKYLDVSGASSAFLETITAGRPLRQLLSVIFGCSQYMSDIITRNPGYLYWLIEQGTWDATDTVESLVLELESGAANFQSVEEKLHAVRRLHRRQLLKIGVRDLLGEVGVVDTTVALSDLADAIVQVVLRLIWAGEITDRAYARDFAVVAMGKLGGGELNYSSDIDLIYVCNDVDDDAFAAFSKLSNQLTKALSAVTREGYLYRVDLRLRPDGSVGPVVNTLTAMRIYYENRGRPWEFQAMLKARVIAGDPAIGARFLEHISQLVFNPTLSYSPVETVSLMRMQIRQNISDKERSLNIKLMEGGIRDIEFIVQMLQLIHGSRKRGLRTPNSLAGLAALLREGAIKDFEAETMTAAYEFLRLIEHRLQMMHQLKTHSVPESAEEMRLLAARVSHGPAGRFTTDSFLEKLTSSLTQVRVLSDSFFSGHEPPDAATLLLLPAGDGAAASHLSNLGIVDTKRAQSIIQNLAYGTFPDLVDRSTRASFQSLLPGLLAGLAKAGDPDRALINFSNLAKATRSVSPFYRYLAGSTGGRDLIIRLAGTSTLLTDRLCVHMDVLDALLEDPQSLLDEGAGALSWSDLTTDVKDIRLQREVARAVDISILAGWFVGAMSGAFPRALSEAIGTATRRLIVDAMKALFGDMKDIAVFALGSFAVGEPRIGSDVDLLVVTRGQDHEQITRRLHTLNSTLSQGPGLKIDYRLRGEGANAPLVQDLSSYETYFATRVSAWERIAFAKCAFWVGDASLGAAFIDMLKPHLGRALTPPDIEQIRAIRQKLEAMVAASATAFETKRSAGGRYDVEYLTWMGLVLAGEAFDPGMTTKDRISHMAARRLISKADAKSLSESLALFTAIDYLMDLQMFTPPKNDQAAAELATYLNKTLPWMGVACSDVAAQVKAAKHVVRKCYNKVVARLG